MKRLLAVLLVLIGLIGLVLGRLGETTWAPATETTAAVELSDPGPAVVIDPGVLYVGGREGEVTIEGASDVSLITADNSDLEAYLEDTAYTRVTGASDWTTLSSEAVNPEGATELEDPTGSDLWRTVETKPSPYTLDIADFAAEEHGENEQAYRALLIVTDGTEPGAESVSITWPVDDENDWVPFAYAGGAAIAVIGLVLLVVSIGGRRRDEDEELVEDEDEDAAGAAEADSANDDAGTADPGTENLEPAAGEETEPATENLASVSEDETETLDVVDDDPTVRAEPAEDAEPTDEDHPHREEGR